MIIHKILDFIFIPNGRCPLCQRILFFTKNFICHECLQKLKMTIGNKCRKCNKELSENEINYCSDCLQYEYCFNEGYSQYKYEGAVKKLIYLLKFYHNPELAVYLGELLGYNLLKIQWIKQVDMIIPVPLHKNRKNIRGYNQSEKIAQGICQVLNNTNGMKKLKINTTLLLRKKENLHQIELNKIDRFENVKNVFEVVNNEEVKNKVILIIDDVYTTGATINSCCEVLLKKGAKTTYFAVLASGKIQY